MKLCVLIALNGKGIVQTLKQILQDFGDGIELFLYNDGVLLIDDEDFLSLSKHIKTTLCDVSAKERGLKRREGFKFGSLYDLSSMITHADKFIPLADGSL